MFTFSFVRPPSASTDSGPSALTRWVRGILLLLFVTTTAIGLRYLGAPDIDWSDLASWLARSEPEDVVVALVHLAALCTVGYLVLAIAAYVGASLLRVPFLLRGTAAVTPLAVRRVVDGLLAIVVLAGPATMAVPASASPVQAAPTTVTYTPVPAGDVPTPPAEEVAPELLNYVVMPGDSLWSIAESTVETRDPAASGADVADYWRRLMEANVGRLRSGDPSLIYPGETIELPA